VAKFYLNIIFIIYNTSLQSVLYSLLRMS